MAKPEYDNQGNVVKKPFKLKIAGFTFSMGQIIALVLVVAIIALISFASAKKKEREDQLAYEQKMAELEALKAQQGNGQVEFDLHAQTQAALTKQFGVAPEGFEWGYAGELIAIGNDEDHNCEDVVYMFIRALSMLDFSTAARYSSGSVVIDQYQSYYSAITDAITDYYRNFLRKQYKVSLTSMEVLGISDVAVFADGTEYLTIDVLVLDLTDKDFWEKDRDALFKQMRIYKETETDTTKMEQYVYDYIYSKYEDGTIQKKQHTIELVVGKENNSGWLVSGDRELNAYLQYENGVDVARFILNEFSTWYMEVTMQEQLEAIGALTTANSGNGGTTDTETGSDVIDEGPDADDLQELAD